MITFTITYLVGATLYLSSPRLLWTDLTFLSHVNKHFVSNYLIMEKKYQLKKLLTLSYNRMIRNTR